MSTQNQDNHREHYGENKGPQQPGNPREQNNPKNPGQPGKDQPGHKPHQK